MKEYYMETGKKKELEAASRRGKGVDQFEINSEVMVQGSMAKVTGKNESLGLLKIEHPLDEKGHKTGTDGWYFPYQVKPQEPQSDWSRGACYSRDCVIAHIIGMQNGQTPETEGYKSLQTLLETIIDQYGNICQPFKG